MEEVLKQLLAGQNQLFTEIKSIQSDIGSMKEDISSLKSDVSTLKSEVSSIKDDIRVLKSDINFLQSDVGYLKSEVGSIKENVNSLQSDVNSLKSDVSSLKSDVSSLKSDVSSMKGDISSLQSEVGAMKTEMVTKSDLAENTAILRVLEHRSQVQGAELEGLKVSAASHHAIKELDSALSVMKAQMVTKQEFVEFGRSLRAEMNASHQELTHKITNLENKIGEDTKSIFEVVGEHEIKIRTLSRRPV